MSNKLIVVNSIHGRDSEGNRKIYNEGDIYTPTSEDERQYLILTGAARPAKRDSVGVEVEITQEPEGLEALLDDLKVEDIRKGLEFLEVEFDAKGKKQKLLEALIAAGQANPIKFDQFVKELTA